MTNSKKPDLIEREAVTLLIEALIVAAKGSDLPPDMPLRALGLKVSGLPSAGPQDAKWERVKETDMQFPYWRCSACKMCCYAAPNGLEKVHYCPLCGAHTGGIVDAD